MRVVRNFFYFGPNRRTDRTVIEQLVEFEPANLQLISSRADGLVDRLSGILRDNGLLAGAETFPFEPLPSEPRAWFCSLYSQLALFFQQKCGHEASFFTTVPSPDDNRHSCVFEYEHVDVGLSAAKLARKVITLRNRNFRKSFETLREFARSKALPADTRAIIRAANRRDIPVTRLEHWPYDTDWNADYSALAPARPNGQLLLGHGRYQQVVDGTWCRTRTGDPVKAGPGEGELSTLLDRLDVPADVPGSGPRGAGSRYRVIVGNGKVVAVLEAGDSGATGGDLAASTHESILEQALAIYRALDTALLVIELWAPEPGRPLHESGGCVIGLDTAPALDRFLPADSPILDEAADALLGWLFPEGLPARVPIFAVTGTNGKTTTSRMIERILREQGLETGLVCTDGVYIGREQVFGKDQAQAYGHLKVLTSPGLEAAVLETHHSGIATTGFAFRWCDVAVCTNVTDDHLGEHETRTVADIAALKRKLIERARKAAVLNADDPHCIGMIPCVSAERTFLFSLEKSASDLAREHDGLDSFCVLEERDGRQCIVVHEGGHPTAIMPVEAIPATFGGKAGFNIHNAMAAITSAFAMGVAPDSIREAMSSFSMSRQDTPNRLNFFEGLPFRVLVDFAHNPDGMRRLTEFTDAIDCTGKRILLFTGTRNEDHTRRTWKQAAGHFDHYVVQAHTSTRNDYRDERPEYTAALITGVLRENGVAESAITAGLEELDAIEHALDLAGEGDLVVLLLRSGARAAIDDYMPGYIARRAGEIT